ncbi:Ig-like domain-containing protein [Caloramator sp. mosi_1]|uniref:Ig-like domain-containing protein n=1 Tax=Caloramator sp. mosi_1 TaxID=3023090 RepID=UPI003FCC63E1
MKKGETAKLNVNFVPVNATVKKLKWTSSNPDIVAVDDKGVIKAKNRRSNNYCQKLRWWL